MNLFPLICITGIPDTTTGNKRNNRKVCAFLHTQTEHLPIARQARIGMDRKAIYKIIERDDSGSNISKIYDYFMMLMVVISIVPLHFKEQTRLFIIFDQVSVVAFIIDYLLRWFTTDLKHPSRKPLLAFVAYPFSLMAIIDMLSILPSLGILNRGMKVFRIVRLLKLGRVFRFLRYSKRIEILVRVIKKERHVLLTVLGIATFYIFATALLMFNVELNKASDSGVIVFDTFFDALYWATTTLTTVGYGDVYPVSDFGRAVSMLSSLFGVAVIALPSGVITASYLEELRKNKKEDEYDN